MRFKMLLTLLIASFFILSAFTPALAQNPVISDLEPNDSTTISSTDILISWRTSINSTSEVYIKAEDEPSYTEITGKPGKEHYVWINNLTMGTKYTWYARSSNADGSTESEVRSFDVSNGIVFTENEYIFNVERNYDQRVNISVKNTDSKKQDLLVRASNHHEDIIVGFVGEGSIDRIAHLNPDESKNIELVIHTQNTMLEEYTFIIKLTNLGKGNITDYALVYLNISQPEVNFRFKEVTTNLITLAKTFRIKNYGDTITDFSVVPDDNLKSYVIFQPSLTHYCLEKGKTIDIIGTPVWWKENATSITGTLTAMGAGKDERLFVNYSLPVGRGMYNVTLSHIVLHFDLKSGYCINRQHAEDTFYMPPGVGEEDVTSACLELKLDRRSKQDRPYDVEFRINDNLVGALRNTIANGSYSFDFSRSYINYATNSTGKNKVTMDTNMNPGYTTIMSDMYIDVYIDKIRLKICALSEEEAYNITQTIPWIKEKNVEERKEGISPLLILLPIIPLLFLFILWIRERLQS